MKSYGLFDVTFLFIRLYNITNVQTNVQNSLATSRTKFQDPKDLADVCSLPSQRGSCNGNVKRHYFHRSSGRCFVFMYSGCEGNQNNFNTKEECQQRCGKNQETTQVSQKRQIDVCSLVPPERGLCRGNLRRYFFDRSKGQCILFEYGGCGANQNFFMSEEQCLQRCGRKEVATQGVHEYAIDVCGLEPDKGPCPNYIRRYFFDRTTGKCMLLAYGGCSGNQNNFPSEEKCMQRCGRNEAAPQNPQEDDIDVCDMPAERGTCNGNSQRYHYNKLSNQCALFTYSGCGGNQNNFESEEECQQHCGEIEVTEECGENEQYDECGTACPLTCENYQHPPDICTLQCVIGCRCQEGFVRTTDKRCVRTEQCPTTVPVSLTTVAQGVLTASVLDDIAAARTARFGDRHTFTGVRITTALPSRTFHTRTPLFSGDPICKLEKSVGTGKLKLFRFYYNKRSGQCEQLDYGGYDGNANNFFSKEYCELICIRQIKYRN